SRAQVQRGRRWRWAIVALVIVFLLVLVTVRILTSPADQTTPPAGGSATESPTAGEALEVAASTTLTVPDTLRMKSRAFDGEEGETYLLRFSATAAKPAGTPGDAMYFGANLACGGPGGGTLRS